MWFIINEPKVYIKLKICLIMHLKIKKQKYAVIIFKYEFKYS